jgi:catechol 2,3-dioxygenase-like lactoylglutathione lyase family enzyme
MLRAPEREAKARHDEEETIMSATATDTATQARSIPATHRAPDSFAHAVLRSARFEEMIDWYRKVLCARVAFRNDKLCFLTYDHEHHRVAVINVAGLPEQDTATSRLAHLAYTYDDLGSLLAAYKRLKAEGIVPFRPIHHGPTVSMYYRDPDGTAIELQVDAFKTKEEAQAYFDSEAFRTNPIGVAFDPEALCAAYEAGTPLPDLLRRPDGPAAPMQG